MATARELKMIDVKSKKITDLTTDAFADEDPAVSPDGTEVAFASKRAGSGEYDLFLLNIATLEITPLPTMSGDEHDPAWSPGGRYLVFSGGADGQPGPVHPRSAPTSTHHDRSRPQTAPT